MSKKKSKFSPDESLSEINARIRGFILDSQVTEADHISLLLGCPPVSEEVSDREVDASDARLKEIEHLIPLLYMYARTMAEGIVEHQRAHVEDVLDEDEALSEELTSAVWIATRKAFANIALNSLLGAVSQLVDMGFLETRKDSRWAWLKKLMR